MKVAKSNLIALLFFSVLSFSLSAQNFQVKSSEMTIAGTSTLHDWVSNVTQVNGAADFTFADGALTSISNLSLTIPVKGIVSTKGSTMDSKTYGALEAETHPNITYKLTKVTSILPSATGVTIIATGDLTIAGTTKPIDLLVTGTYLGNNGIRFEGSKAFNMTDFGVDPPTAMLGTLHTGDKVTIKFKVSLETSNASAYRN